MKKHLLTRILSITLAFTILSSDISAYAASEITEEPAVSQTEEIIEEADTETEIETNDEEALRTEPIETELEMDVPIVEEVITEDLVVAEEKKPEGICCPWRDIFLL